MSCNVLFFRWKRDKENKRITQAGKFVLEFVAIQRSDNKSWALPGVSLQLDLYWSQCAISKRIHCVTGAKNLSPKNAFSRQILTHLFNSK